MSMANKKLTIPIEIEKASRLVELLREAQQIISSLCIGK